MHQKCSTISSYSHRHHSYGLVDRFVAAVAAVAVTMAAPLALQHTATLVATTVGVIKLMPLGPLKLAKSGPASSWLRQQHQEFHVEA